MKKECKKILCLHNKWLDRLPDNGRKTKKECWFPTEKETECKQKNYMFFEHREGARQ